MSGEVLVNESQSPQARPGNSAALTHGGTSDVQIGRRSVVEKRRLLRQIGLRQNDLDSLGRAYLGNWARAAAALHLMDAYAAENGWLKADGEPRGFARLYVAMLNSERLALTKLQENLRERQPRDLLGEYLAREYGNIEDGEVVEVDGG